MLLRVAFKKVKTVLVKLNGYSLAEVLPPIAASSPQHAPALRTDLRGLLLKAGRMFSVAL
jgi:hypothetical protein